MSDDTANAEMGIAVSDAVAGQKRLRGEKGFEKQKSWGTSYLNQRILASASGILLIGLTVALLSEDIPNLAKILLTAGFFVFVILYGVVAIRRRTAIRNIRQKQVEEHSGG